MEEDHDPFFSAAWLSRLRRSRSMKQEHLAEIIGVSQGTVSKWETGSAVPSERQKGRILDAFSAPLTPLYDAWISRLVECSPLQVHAMCDTQHCLLAASPSRIKEWRRDYADVSSSPLSRSLPRDISQAEQWLQERDSPQARLSTLVVRTSGRTGGAYDIEPALLLWERFPLSDGRWVRIVTNIGIDEIPDGAIQLVDEEPRSVNAAAPTVDAGSPPR